MSRLVPWLLGTAFGVVASCPFDHLTTLGRAHASEPAGEGVGELDLTDPATCSACHQRVAAEWAESMHARAHHDSDPIYGSMRAFRVERQGAQLARECASCHNPVAPDDLDSTAARAGVGCLACHATAHVDRTDGKMGAAALVRSKPLVLRGPHDFAPDASPIHATGPAAPHLVDGETICLACHEATRNPQGVAACTTGDEYAVRASEATCVDCHMPRVDGASGSVSRRTDHASHAFLGPHRAWLQDDPSFLASAVALSAELEGETLVVELENRSSHAFPSGFPGRQAILEVRLLDRAGRPVEQGQMRPSRVVLGKVYVDDHGRAALPPFASALARDTRLETDETRAFRFDTGRRAHRFEVTLGYRLGPPVLFERLKLSDRPEAETRIIRRVTVERGDGSMRRGG